MAYVQRKQIFVENTNFAPFRFATNFSGNPDRDAFGNTTRKAQIIIPEDQALDLIQEGFNIKHTNPRDGEEEGFVPIYFTTIICNYRPGSLNNPKIKVISGDSNPILMDENNVGAIDDMYVKNVNAILNPYTNSKTGRKSLYVDVLYVEQDIGRDPFAARYMHD